jgi:hypothetical protein
MHSDSVEAYDLPERVRTYDADMDRFFRSNKRNP